MYLIHTTYLSMLHSCNDQPKQGRMRRMNERIRHQKIILLKTMVVHRHTREDACIQALTYRNTSSWLDGCTFTLNMPDYIDTFSDRTTPLVIRVRLTKTRRCQMVSPFWLFRFVETSLFVHAYRSSDNLFV